MPSDLNVFLANERAVVALWRDILISIWRADAAVEDVQVTQRAQTLLMKTHGAYGSLAIAERTALGMSKEARDEAARLVAVGRRGDWNRDAAARDLEVEPAGDVPRELQDGRRRRAVTRRA